MKKILEGYKETELGVIPQEWEIKQIDDVAEEIFLGLTSKVDYVENGGFPLVRASDISKGKLSFESVKFISEEQHKKLTKLRKVEKGDVLISKSGTLGTCVIVECDTEFSIYESIIAVKIKSEIFFPKYLVQLLQDTKIQSNMLGARVGGAVGHLNLQTFRKLIISLPTLPEQQKIAEILSSVDDHIEKLDETISEYELLKKGMMKKLLTEGIGHTEFKETELGRIPKEWEVKRIEDVAITASGGTPSRAKEEYYINGSIPWIKTGELKQKYIYKVEEFITEEAVKNSSAKLIEKDSIIIAMYGATIGNLSITKISCTTNQACCCIKTKDNMDSEYLYYFLLNDKENIISKGAGGAQPNISQQIVKNHLILMPSLPEQQEIASILSSVDERIDLYKSEKEDFVQVKKGLMEKLLTGKIRV